MYSKGERPRCYERRRHTVLVKVSRHYCTVQAPVLLLLLCIHAMADAEPKGSRKMRHPRKLKKKKNYYYSFYVYACDRFYD